MMPAAIKLAVIDDHPLFREGVVRTLDQIGGFEIVAQGGSRDDALRISEDQRLDILLMDISVPGGGLSAIEPALERNPALKIVMLTVSEENQDVMTALQSGARGYVLKGVGSRTLAAILRTVALGERYVCPQLSARVLVDLSTQSTATPKADVLAELTNREKEILTLVAAGLSNKRIGLHLNLHEKTIKHHMTRILAKLKVNNRTEAAMTLRDATERQHSPVRHPA